MATSIPSSTLEKFITFGDLLRFLRRRIGLTQMELAISVGYSNTQISRLEQNDRLPDIPTIEARFVSPLELEEEPQAVARLLDLAANVRREDAPMPGLCPYKGLNYFDESDANLFVGREALVAKLTERVFSLSSNRARHETRFLAIVGASGSGKSSLVRAGLVSALRWNKASTDWQLYTLTPTTHPLESLAAALTQESDSVVAIATLMDDLARDQRSLQLFARRLLGARNESCLLLVVDQFEELFALCHSDEERSSFIGNLLTAASEPDGSVLIVITLRADFYAPCANYPALREALAKQQEYIGAMSNEELRRAIEEPARRGRWEFEPGLVDLLLHDVGHEPGALPLLSHALFETWQRRRGHTMTLSGYTSSGGVRGAIAETAESVFVDQFTDEQQAIARGIFLRLTELGDETGAGDTRRRAKLNELILRPEETVATQTVLKTLADARLITTSEDSAEVAHEALIREWPTLHGWLEENRAGLRLHRQLTESANEWIMMNRESDLLFRGGRLAQVQEWAITHANEMNATEQEFLAASQDWAEREAAEREAQRQRELEAAQKLAETEHKSATRLRGRNRIITTVGVITLVLAVLAVVFGSNSNRNAQKAQDNLALANQQRNAAQNAQATAQAASTEAIADFIQSEAQRLAAEANSLRLARGDPNLIALLAIRSLNMKYTPAGDAVLTSLNTLQTPPRVFKQGHTDQIWDMAISPDGKYLVTASKDKTARLWDVATGETIRVFSGHTDVIDGIAFSSDGKYIVTGSHDRTARLWDVATGQTVQVFTGQSAAIEFVAISPDGQNIVTTSQGEVRVWDVATGKTIHVFTGDSKRTFLRVVYSPDGKYILAASDDKDNTVHLWNAVTWEQIRIFSHGTPEGVQAVAFSPDGKTIATGEWNIAVLWDMATGRAIRELTGYSDFINDIKFSPDGHFLLAGGAGTKVGLWDVSTGKMVRRFSGISSVVQGVAFSPDGKFVITAGDDKIVSIWSLQTSPGGMVFAGHGLAVRKASFSPDGKLVVTASDDMTARIWDSATGQTLVTLIGHTAEVTDAVFSPDGKMVLTASADKTARLWDATTGKEIRRFEGHTDEVEKVLFSPNGKDIVTASYDGTARVWETQTGKLITTYTHQNSGQLIRAAFSPDGKTVATTGTDHTARLWDPMSGKDLMIFKGHTNIVTGVAFSPDGKLLLTSSWDGTARLWDIASGKEIRQFVGHTGTVFGAAFSPDRKYILTSGADQTARLWDVQTGQELRRFAGHTDEVRYVAFSPDGKYILTSSQDGTARLWLTNLNDTIHAVCALLTRDLTKEERTQFDITDQNATCPAK